jgi:class 3 adenylate cyclase
MESALSLTVTGPLANVAQGAKKLAKTARIVVADAVFIG